MPAPPTFDARLVSARNLSPAVRELRFERVDGSSLIFEAGQWLSVTLPLAGDEARRSYSIASAPTTDTPSFELAVTHVAPHDGVTGFATDGSFAMTFSEPVDCASFRSNTTLLEKRDTHAHWVDATQPADGRPVAGAWACADFPATDPLRLEGRCRASNTTDATDYCTVRFVYDSGVKLGTSSTFTLKIVPT